MVTQRHASFGFLSQHIAPCCICTCVFQHVVRTTTTNTTTPQPPHHNTVPPPLVSGPSPTPQHYNRHITAPLKNHRHTGLAGCGAGVAPCTASDQCTQQLSTKQVNRFFACRIDPSCVCHVGELTCMQSFFQVSPTSASTQVTHLCVYQ